VNLAERLRAQLEREAEFSAVRAQGAGGQNVNKVASAVHLRFDVHASGLPDAHKARLLAVRDQRLSTEGVIVIKAQEERTQARNRALALQRLLDLVLSTATPPKRRVATQPTHGSRQRRLEGKSVRSGIKRLRGKVTDA
jgi:protein subunit release factor B